MKLCLTTILCCLSISLQAATYYVDFATGSDSNAGTTEGAPFKHAPGDDNATGTAASTTLSAGDTVKFKGGVEYVGEVDLDWSGTSGSPITYDGNHSEDWGTGRAIINGYNTNQNAFYADTSGRSGYVIKGFELTDLGGLEPTASEWSNDCGTPLSYTSALDGAGINLWISDHNNLHFENLLIHRTGVFSNAPPVTSNAIQGYGIKVADGANIVVTNCTFRDMKIGVALRAGKGSPNSISNAIVTDSSFSGLMVWGVDCSVQAGSTEMRSILITNNLVFDFQEYDLGNFLGCGEKPHTDGMFFRNSGSTGTITWTNVTVSANRFYSNNSGSSQGGTAGIFVSEGPSVNIWNNEFIGWPSTGAISIGHNNTQTGVSYIRIFNNSFLDTWPALKFSGETTNRVMDVRNNLFQHTGTGDFILNMYSGIEPATYDYNLYYDPAKSSATKDVAYWLGGYYTLSELQAAESVDANSVYGDPLLVDDSNDTTGASASSNDLRLSVGSPAIGAGADLSAFFTVDKDGNTRSSWDIGAFEYQQPGANNVTVSGSIRF